MEGGFGYDRIKLLAKKPGAGFEKLGKPIIKNVGEYDILNNIIVEGLKEAMPEGSWICSH